MKDTIICAASEESFNSLFRDQGMWASVEIDKNIRNDLKYCALYRTKEGMITDYAEIIEDIGIIELPQSAQKE